MNIVDWLNIISGGASLVLAIVAIFITLFLYCQTKNTEKNVAEALASIKAQTDALQKLTGRWIDRLTKYATEGNPANENMVHILAAIQQLPTNLAQSIPPLSQYQIDQLTKETISGYIGLFYYASVANIFSQFSLPPLENFDEKNNSHLLVREIVNQSAADVKYVENLIKNISVSALKENSLSHLYEKTLNMYRNLVKDFGEVCVQSGQTKT